MSIARLPASLCSCKKAQPAKAVLDVLSILPGFVVPINVPPLVPPLIAIIAMPVMLAMTCLSPTDQQLHAHEKALRCHLKQLQRGQSGKCRIQNCLYQTYPRQVAISPKTKASLRFINSTTTICSYSFGSLTHTARPEGTMPNDAFSNWAKSLHWTVAKVAWVLAR